MEQIFKKIKSMSGNGKIFWICASLYFVVQFLVIVYLNLWQMPYFTGYDASAYYVLAHEMVEQQTMMVENFVYNTTTMLWDSPLLLAALFHLFLDDIFLCYGLANIISALFIIFTLVLFCESLGMGCKGKLTALILLFTPYVSNYYTYNDLGYVSMLFISMGAYAWRLPCILWIYILFLEWDENGFTKKNRWKFLLGLIFLILNSISSGSFILVFGIAPLLVFVLLRGIYEDKWLNTHHNVIVFVGVILLCSLFSQIFTRYILNFEYLDTSSSWISLHDFFANLQNLVLGFLELLGALPLESQVSVFEIEGILYGMRLFIAFALVLAVPYELWKGMKQKTSYQVMACFLICHILIFTLLDTKYGANIFEIRYLIFAVVVLFSLFGCWIQRIASYKNKSFRTFLAISLSICLISTEITSFQDLQHEKTNFKALETVSNYLSGYADNLVFFAGESEYFSVFAANMRAVDFTKTYKFSPDLKTIYHCADYDYFDDNGAYEGGSFLITVPWMFHVLDEVFQNSYELIHSFPEYEIYIYYADENPVDLSAGFANHPISRDFPYSDGVIFTENMGEFTENGYFYSNGTEGILCYSTFPITTDDFVNFRLYYEGISGKETLGFFEILVDDVMISSAPINIENKMVEIPIKNLATFQNKNLTYRIYLEDGTEMFIHSFEMERTQW